MSSRGILRLITMAGLALAVAVAAAVPALSEPTGAVVAAPPERQPGL
jgi:hypothetical protein